MTDTVNVKELQAQLEQVLAENRSLKKSKEKFGLTFKRHAEQGEAQLLRKGQIPFLIKDDGLSVIKEEPQSSDHLLIEGDNLSALVMMQATHKGKVDVIYIDPPYNTGNNDFVYNDRYVSNDDGFRHSKWLSFMERRLVLAKELLSETGVIFVSIDDNEQAALKMLMDSVFGEQNFMGTLTWFKKRKGSFLSKGVISVTEYVLVFQKEKQVLLSGGLADNSESQPIIKRTNSHKVLQFPPDSVKTKLANGTYLKNTYGEGSSSTKLLDDIEISDGVILNAFSLSGPFVWSQLFLDQELSSGTEILINTKNLQPRALRHNNISHKGLPSFIDGREFSGTNEDSYDMLKRMFGDVKRFDYAKPVNFIERLINSAAFDNPNAIILDFFAGSGTTGHAVAQLNAEDGGNRQCILVTNNFEEDGSPNGIARDATAVRVKAVLTGKWADGKERDPLPGNLHYYQIQFRNCADEFEEAMSWEDGQYAGLAALANNAHNSLTHLTNPIGALYSFISKGKVSLLRSNEEAVLIWEDYEGLMPDEEEQEIEIEEALAEFLKISKKEGLAPRFLVCSESADNDNVPSSYFFEGTPTQAFPQPYLNQIVGTVKPLIAQGMLVPLEGVELEEESEMQEDVESYDAAKEADEGERVSLEEVREELTAKERL